MTLQIRDVAVDDVKVLRARAKDTGMSLSAYIRQLLHEEAVEPSNAEVMKLIAAEPPVNLTVDDIRSYIEAERTQ